MVVYLKKTKIRNILLDLGYTVPALKDCTYRFYRGSEWLKFFVSVSDDGQEIYYNVYVSGSYMSIELCSFDPYKNSVTSLNNCCFVGNKFRDLIKA